MCACSLVEIPYFFLRSAGDSVCSESSVLLKSIGNSDCWQVKSSYHKHLPYTKQHQHFICMQRYACMACIIYALRPHQFPILKCNDFIFTLWQHMLIILENINHFSTVSILRSHCSAISVFTVDEDLPTGVIAT